MNYISKSARKGEKTMERKKHDKQKQEDGNLLLQEV